MLSGGNTVVGANFTIITLYVIICIMPGEYVMPSLASLSYEQELAQRGKRQNRLTVDYENRIFHSTGYNPENDEFNNFLGDSILGAMSLDGLLCGLYETRNYDQIHWADMGCGEAKAMMQTASNANFRQLVKMTAIDIASNLQPNRAEFSTKHQADPVANDNLNPSIIRANIEDVTLDQPANLITAIEVVQYLYNPLKTLCNWYNQLDDDSIAVIACGFNWSTGLRKNYALGDSEKPFGLQIVDQLAEQGTQIITGNGMLTNNFGEYGRMALQKIGGTKLKLNASVTGVESTPVYHYKTVYYEADDTSRPIIELV
jgi:hypothetical protein